MAIELSCLSEVIDDRDRTKVMAWYNLVGSFATALGTACCGCFVSALLSFSYSYRESLQGAMILYAILQSGMIVTFSLLSEKVESNKKEDKTVMRLISK